jgi:hypothetical protein
VYAQQSKENVKEAREKASDLVRASANL